jgi:hypothetical protein
MSRDNLFALTVALSASSLACGGSLNHTSPTDAAAGLDSNEGPDAGTQDSSGEAEANRSSAGDAGPDAFAPSDATSTSQSVAGQCTAVFTALCTQAITLCGDTGFTLGQCVSANLPTCCTGSRCSQASQFSSSDVSACASAIRAEDCALIALNNTPSQCADFVRDQ